MKKMHILKKTLAIFTILVTQNIHPMEIAIAKIVAKQAAKQALKKAISDENDNAITKKAKEAILSGALDAVMPISDSLLQPAQQAQPSPQIIDRNSDGGAVWGFPKSNDPKMLFDQKTTGKPASDTNANPEINNAIANPEINDDGTITGSMSDTSLIESANAHNKHSGASNPREFTLPHESRVTQEEAIPSNELHFKDVQNLPDMLKSLKHLPEAQVHFEQQLTHILDNLAQAVHPDATPEQIESLFLSDLKIENIKENFVQNLQQRVIERAVYGLSPEFELGSPELQLNEAQSILYNTNPYSAHRSFVGAPQEIIDTLNAAITTLQEDLAKIVYDSDGYYKGFDSTFEKEHWAHKVAEFAEAHAHSDFAEFQNFLADCRAQNIEAFEYLAKAKVDRENKAYTWFKRYRNFSGTSQNPVTLNKIKSVRFEQDLTKLRSALRSKKFELAQHILNKYKESSSTQTHEHYLQLSKLYRQAGGSTTPSTTSTTSSPAASSSSSAGASSSSSGTGVILSDQTATASETKADSDKAAMDREATDLIMTHAEVMAQIESTVSDCTDASGLFNKLGLTKEAMLSSSLAEYLKKVLTTIDPFYRAHEAAAERVAQRGYSDIAQELDIANHKIVEFKTGALIGSIPGFAERITNIRKLIDGIAHNFQGLTDIAKYIAEQDALNDAFDTGGFEHVRAGLQKNLERANQTQEGLRQFKSRLEQTMEMTDTECREAGYAVGKAAGEELAQLYAMHKLATGLTKATREINKKISQAIESRKQSSATSTPKESVPTRESNIVDSKGKSKATETKPIRKADTSKPAQQSGASSSSSSAPAVEESGTFKGAVEEPAGRTPLVESPELQKTKEYIQQLTSNSEPGSIWEKITPTQERWNPYSSFPKSFEIEVNGKKFWVNPNGSKHMMEMTSPAKEVRDVFDPLRNPWSIPAKEFKMAHEQILHDFSAALQEAIKNGIPYKQRITVNNWQLEIGYSRITGGHPTIIHARPLSS